VPAATKLLWLRRREPQNWERLAHWLLPHDYINFWLTGRLCMEVRMRGGEGWGGVGWRGGGRLLAGCRGAPCLLAGLCLAAVLSFDPASFSASFFAVSLNLTLPAQASDASGTGLLDATSRSWDMGEHKKHEWMHARLFACTPCSALPVLPAVAPCLRIASTAARCKQCAAMLCRARSEGG